MDSSADCLGVTSCKEGKGALIHFDTEQSRYDHFRVVSTALRRANQEVAPEWLWSFSIAQTFVKERRALLHRALTRAKGEHGAIRSVFLDGVADFCSDPNDSDEAFDLVEELRRFAIDFETVFVCVLHENPGSEKGGKTRGHLGSHLERKAESNLRLVKDREGVTTAFTEKSRQAHITKDSGPCFAWSRCDRMHVTVATRREVKMEARRRESSEFAAAVFEGMPTGGAFRWRDIVKRIEEVGELKQAGALSRLRVLIEDQAIRKERGLYNLANPEPEAADTPNPKE